MGVAPKAIVEKTYFEYRLKYIVPTFTHQIVALYDNIAGCALSAPDGSSPRGYSRIFLGIDSKNEFFFLDSSVSFMSVFIDFLGHHQYVELSYHTFAKIFPISVHLLSCSDFPVYSNSCDVIIVLKTKPVRWLDRKKLEPVASLVC
jgi:hypothetical protein